MASDPSPSEEAATSASMASDPVLLEDAARYPGLSEKDLESARSIECTEKQLAALNERGLKTMLDKLEKYTLKIIDRPVESWQGKELRLVILGSTGVGKSGLGNLIIGENCFDESSQSLSCTQTIKAESTTADGVTVHIIDTPGLNDTNKSDDDTLTEVAKVFDKFSDGIHGFLFVYNVANPRFTEEQQSAFEELKNLFGPTFIDSCYIVISHGDAIANKISLKEYLNLERTPTEKDGKSSIFWKLVTDFDCRIILAEAYNLNYLRQLQKEQIVRFICTASNSENAYLHKDFEKHKQQIREKVKDALRLVPDMERWFIEYLKEKPHWKLSKLGGKESSDIAEEFFRQNKEELWEEVQSCLQRILPRIEEEISNHLQDKSHEELHKLKGKPFDRIAGEIFQKVKSETTEWIPDMVLREAVQTLLYGGKERLINPTFLERLKSFVKPLLVLAKIK